MGKGKGSFHNRAASGRAKVPPQLTVCTRYNYGLDVAAALNLAQMGEQVLDDCNKKWYKVSSLDFTQSKFTQRIILVLGPVPSGCSAFTGGFTRVMTATWPSTFSKAWGLVMAMRFPKMPDRGCSGPCQIPPDKGPV